MSDESSSKVSEVFIIFKGYMSHANELYSFMYTKFDIIIIAACVFVMSLSIHVLYRLKIIYETADIHHNRIISYICVKYVSQVYTWCTWVLSSGTDIGKIVDNYIHLLGLMFLIQNKQLMHCNLK